MYRIFILFLLMVGGLPLCSFGDSGNFQITGKAVDSLSKKGVPFVTITVQNSQNKVLKRLASDGNGTFDFTLKDNATGELIITAVGYKAATVKFSVKEGSKKENLGAIAISESSTKLDQVVVQAQKQLVKIEPDKISYNPEADPESQTITALDMMRKVPLLSVDGDDNIKLKGASNYKILINGKESPVMSNNAKDVLKSMPANSIKNIEVITNPSSKYSSEGIGGIINIITTKKGLSGIAGNVSLRTDNYGGYGGNAYATATLGKFAFSFNYGHSKWKRPTSNSYSEVNRFNTPELFKTTTNGGSKSNSSHDFASGEVSYEIDSLNLISASFMGFGGSWKNKSNLLSNTFSMDGQRVQNISYLNDNKSSWSSISGNVDYQRSFKKPDKLFTVSYKYDYNPSSDRNYRDSLNLLSNGNGREKSKNTAGSYESTFQLDFVNPITQKHQYEMGVKYILRTNPSDVDYRRYNFTTNEWDVYQARVQEMDYTQNIVAGYVGYLLKLQKYSFKGGLRVEGAYTDASFKQATAAPFSNNLTDMVPYATISYNPSEASSFKISYTQRLQRPGIWHLNPYVDNSSVDMVSFGNPKLKTERVNSFDLGYTFYKSTFNFDISIYSRLNNNPIQPVTYLVHNGLYARTYKNTGKNDSHGGSFYGSITPSPKFSLSLGASAEYNLIEGKDNDGKSISNDGWTKELNGNFRWNFMKGFTFSGYGGYGSGWRDLHSKSSSYCYNGVNLRKEFLDKTLGLTISVSNPFEKDRTWKRTFQGPGFTSYNEQVERSRSFSFGITYRFGKMGTMVKKAQRGISNDDVKGGGSKGGSGGGGGK